MNRKGGRARSSAVSRGRPPGSSGDSAEAVASQPTPGAAIAGVQRPCCGARPVEGCFGQGAVNCRRWRRRRCGGAGAAQTLAAALCKLWQQVATTKRPNSGLVKKQAQHSRRHGGQACSRAGPPRGASARLPDRGEGPRLLKHRRERSSALLPVQQQRGNGVQLWRHAGGLGEGPAARQPAARPLQRASCRRRLPEGPRQCRMASRHRSGLPALPCTPPPLCRRAPRAAAAASPRGSPVSCCTSAVHSAPPPQTPGFSFGSAPAFGATPSLPKATSTPLFNAASTPGFGAASTPGAGSQGMAGCQGPCSCRRAAA